ncbi:hypothetical protein HYC85_011291 [Camellia sinensis]|uniref:Uncharacterized protein n=1 Tax=Camellia sinensis TaxID=4442 RepID=A0A7J7HBT9_CAMSI|nr:hypothetical protein HYC85_011291 [Camellia sinensis]
MLSPSVNSIGQSTHLIFLSTALLLPRSKSVALPNIVEKSNAVTLSQGRIDKNDDSRLAKIEKQVIEIHALLVQGHKDTRQDEDEKRLTKVENQVEKILELLEKHMPVDGEQVKTPPSKLLAEQRLVKMENQVGQILELLERRIPFDGGHVKTPPSKLHEEHRIDIEMVGLDDSGIEKTRGTQNCKASQWLRTPFVKFDVMKKRPQLKPSSTDNNVDNNIHDNLDQLFDNLLDQLGGNVVPEIPKGISCTDETALCGSTICNAEGIVVLETTSVDMLMYTLAPFMLVRRQHACLTDFGPNSEFSTIASNPVDIPQALWIRGRRLHRSEDLIDRQPVYHSLPPVTRRRIARQRASVQQSVQRALSTPPVYSRDQGSVSPTEREHIPIIQSEQNSMASLEEMVRYSDPGCVGQKPSVAVQVFGSSLERGVGRSSERWRPV